MELTPYPKPIRWESKAYRDFVRKHDCVFCYTSGGTKQFHHLRQFCFTGIGTKPPDSYGVPAHPGCHLEDHRKPCKESWLLGKCVEFLTEYLSRGLR